MVKSVTGMYPRGAGGDVVQRIIEVAGGELFLVVLPRFRRVEFAEISLEPLQDHSTRAVLGELAGRIDGAFRAARHLD